MATNKTFEIPFHLRSAEPAKWVSGIDHNTTCQDVVVILMQEMGKSVRMADNYLLVEQWRGIERVLAPNAKVLKLWHSWRDESSQVKFVVKKVVGKARNEDYVPHKRRPLRRRNSGSNSSRASDTLHPRKMQGKVYALKIINIKN